MELVSLKIPKKSKEELKKMKEPCGLGCDYPEYPYGFQLSFNKEQIDKIPFLAGCKVGEKILIQAEATITSIRMSERQGGKEDHSVEVQIEDIGCELAKKKKPEEMSLKEYRRLRESK